MVEVKRVAEKWEIWDKEEEMTKLEVDARKSVPEKFHKWIKVFGKKQSEQMPIRKVWDHVIEMKEGFMPRKGKIYLLSRKEREEVLGAVHTGVEVRRMDSEMSGLVE